MSEGDEEFGDYVAQEEVEGQRNEQNGESGRVETSLPQFYKSPPSDDGRQTNEEEDSQASDEVEGSVTQDTDQLSSSSEVQRPPLSDDGVAPDSLPSRQHSRNPSLQSNNLAFSPSSAINATPGTPDSTRSSSLLVHSLDKRFKTRLNELSDSRAHSRSSSTSTLAKHLRSTSQHSSIDDLLSTGLEDSETSTPWEAIRWTKLRKLSNQLYSENAMRSYGSPTVVLPSSTIAVGTSKGVVLCFDYHQSLKTVLTLKSGRTLTPGGGNVVSSDQLGHVTSLAVSADQTYIGAGYSTGYIITWELAKPSTPNLQIPPIGSDFLGKPKYDGHLEGSPVLHLNFCGKRHSMLVSGDVRGMAFSHNAVRSIMGRTVKTRRVLGRYPQNSPSSKRKPTSVLALACQPLGTEMQPSDEICLVAIMTPYMLALISTVPSPQTQYKIDNKEKETNLEMGLSACLAWFPVLKTTNGGGGSTPKLAYCWSNVVNVVEVESTKDSVTETVSVNPKFTKKFVCDESVVSIQWASRHVSFVLGGENACLLTDLF
ncbi:hypothetical protein TRICI_001929 [Trichomonascus ciferrii]|uniref:Uncharacterized protein n=1 Tax=Trichomonascus ciferrii TaxID=44093 RepID=A0A642VC52_9ASCO|nr:hypothetical protein TRICI_001929 [Trichomonascus ciferrii]